MGLDPGQQLLLEQCLALTRGRLSELARFLILQVSSYSLRNRSPKTRLRRRLTKRVGVGFFQAGLALRCFPAPGLCGSANKLAGRQHPVDPLRTMTAAIAAVGLSAGRIMPGINAKHCAS